MAWAVANVAADAIDGDRVDDYITNGFEAGAMPGWTSASTTW